MKTIFASLISMIIGGAATYGYLKLPTRSPAADIIDNQIAPGLPSLASLPSMNGIDPREADRFWETWHFVTARFRKDNGQVRIVFANDIAWDSMVHRRKTFPNGAMFAKAIFIGADDPVFPASIVPKTYHEVELMKKDDRLYPDSDGWGFALYEYLPDLSIVPLKPETSRSLMKSCSACHAIVKERSDSIYALPATLQWHLKDPKVDESYFEDSFKAVERGALNEFGQKVMAKYGKRDSKMLNVFSLPYFETGQRLSIYSVAQFTLKHKQPHLILGEKTRTFLWTQIEGDCVNFVMTAQGSPQLVDFGRVCGAQIIYDKKEPMTL